jgi:hypothetical protein
MVIHKMPDSKFTQQTYQGRRADFNPAEVNRKLPLGRQRLPELPPDSARLAVFFL